MIKQIDECQQALGFSNREKGATLLEYGWMVALIAVVCIASVTQIGTKLVSMFGLLSPTL